jgi:hypothetical protein
MSAAPIDRLLARCRDENGCWVIDGVGSHGYGSVQISRGYGILAHRLAYEYFIAEIPPGLELDHLCRNKPCCNPWHLEPVTHRENMRRHIAATRPTCPRGHSEFSIGSNGKRTCLPCRRVYDRARRPRKRDADGGACTAISLLALLAGALLWLGLIVAGQAAMCELHDNGLRYCAEPTTEETP